MRKIMLLSASLLFSACGEVGGVIEPINKVCSGTISPAENVTISAGQTTSVVLEFQNCLNVTVRADNDPVYVNGVTVASNATLSLSPAKATVYTFIGNGEGAQPTLRLAVNVVGKPDLSIDGSAIPDSGVALNSTVQFVLNRQYISSCSAPVFNGTPTTADPKTVKATATISGETLVYSPGSTMPALVGGKRQVTITVSCLGQDGTTISASITKLLVVPALQCTKITPDSVSTAWTGNLWVECLGNSVTSFNGVDFKGTLVSLGDPNSAPNAEVFITNVGNFQDANHYVMFFGRIGPPVTQAYDVGIWYKNPERSDTPLRFVLRLRP